MVTFSTAPLQVAVTKEERGTVQDSSQNAMCILGCFTPSINKSFNDPCYHCMCLLSLHTTCNPGTKPTLPELLRFTCTDKRVVNIPVEIATKYVQFGTFLLDDRNGSRVKIMAHKHHYDAEQINMEIIQEWLAGRGKQPVTWATLVEVLCDIELSTLAVEIETIKCLQNQSQETK